MPGLWEILFINLDYLNMIICSHVEDAVVISDELIYFDDKTKRAYINRFYSSDHTA